MREASEPNALSRDGRYLVFTTASPRIVPGEWAGRFGVYLVDLEEGRFELVNQPIGVAQSEGTSFGNDVSDDGRWVLFTSSAQGFVDGEEGEGAEVYLLDRTTREIQLISQSSDGVPSNRISSGSSFLNEHQVLFGSGAENLVADWNGEILRNQVFLRDLETEETSLITKEESGEHFRWGIEGALAHWSDGAVVRRTTDDRQATPPFHELVKIDLLSSSITSIVMPFSEDSGMREINDLLDISLGGHRIVFSSSPLFGSSTVEVGNLLYLYEEGQEVRLISELDEEVGYGENGLDLSDNGEVVAYVALKSGTKNIVVKNLESGSRIDVMRDCFGSEPQSKLFFYPMLSEDGRVLVFSTAANGLVPQDTNDQADIFIVELDWSE